MFGRSRAIPFNPYGARRSRGRPPRWLVLLLAGIAIGAVGVIVVQERYLPPRLSASASTELQTSYSTADAERKRLKTLLDDTSRRLAVAVDERKSAIEAAAASRDNIEQLQGDVASAVAALPPDPRGGNVEVRAARFGTKSGSLVYDVVLTRERASAKPMTGVVQFIVAGDGGRTAESTVALKPVALSIGSHQILRGSLPLPDGFKPRQATVQVLDRPGGKSLGMRVLPVK
jgi:hypothetical protein